MTTEKLLEEYDKVTKLHNKERALWNLLKANEKEITGIIENSPTYFHTAFRQGDICANGCMDMAICILLDEAELFWELLDKLLK